LEKQAQLVHAPLEKATHRVLGAAHVLADEFHRAAVQVLQFDGSALVLVQFAEGIR
jgi:hypothetical protein